MSDAEQDKAETILDTKPKPFVFVLMPFAKEFDDVYQLGIKVACEEAGAYAERLDEQLFAESMLQRIYNQIAKADVVVADMTNRNPNVFYEVGYAHALGKVVILLTQEDGDIPFDLKHYRHIVYENVTRLLPELEKVVGWAVKQSNEKNRPGLPVAVYLYGHKLDASTVPAYGTGISGALPLILTYETTDELKAITFSVALWTSNKFSACEWNEPGREPAYEFWPVGTMVHSEPPENRVGAVRHPNRKCVFNRHKPITLLPGQWREDNLHVTVNTRLEKGAKENMEVRISTESGSYSYPFIIEVSE